MKLLQGNSLLLALKAERPRMAQEAAVFTVELQPEGRLPVCWQAAVRPYRHPHYSLG
jgi:hypothetical protein